MSLIYQPEEDSFLLSEVLKKKIKNKNLQCLEIGTGSGILLKTLLDLGVNKDNIIVSDINPHAIEHINNDFPYIKAIQSNLFSKVKGKFDIIIFNPPYLQEDKNEDKESKLATTGGKKGSELINKFLIQAKKYLNKEGKIYLLTSSLTKGIKWNGWKKKKLARKKLFFEELYVWELTF